MRSGVPKRLTASNRDGAIFGQKLEKRYPKKHQKIDTEKVLKIDAKRLQNEAKMDAKINDF